MDERRHNLPAQPTPLIDREQELAAARQRLLRADVRLLTLTGPAGVGKTRLALEVAASLLDEFEHGAWFVDLAPIRRPGLVPAAIAQTLGVRESGRRPLLDRVVAALRERRLLLILDNFEHVLPAARSAAALLAACPKVKVLATSRAPLHLRWERELPLSPLGLPDLGHLPPTAAVGGYPAVALFVERARAVDPNFALDDRNAAAVAEICGRLDGLPLAIELAAARIKVLPPGSLLARLAGTDEPATVASASPLGLLRSGAEDLPSRQQTLRGAIAWSYALLSADEQALFRRLGVFVGGFTLEAAEPIAGLRTEDSGPRSHSHSVLSPQSSVLDLLATLVDHSLLRQDEQPDGAPRFTMLETIREYALEQLEAAGEAAVTRRRHAEHYLALAERAEPELCGPDQVAWLDRLEREHDNLRAALGHLSRPTADEPAHPCGPPLDAEAGTSALRGLRLGSALLRFWDIRGHLAEGRDWLMALLASERAARPGVARARALFAAGRLAYEQGDYAAALALGEDSLALAREVGDLEGVAFALTQVGHVLRIRGNLEGARTLYAESLAIRRALAERGATTFRPGVAISTKCLGGIALARGDLAEARMLYAESLAMERELGHRWEIALSLHRLGEIACDLGEHVEAGARFAEGLDVAGELRDRQNVALLLGGIAGLAAAEGRDERALRLAGAADALREAVGCVLDPAEQIRVDRRLAPACARLGEARYARARARGSALSPEQAIAEARAALGPAPTPTEAPGAAARPARPARGKSLTRREREVAQLIVRGLTNRQIADELVVGERTVEMHVSNALAKLGLLSRAQVAVWAAEHLPTNTVPNLRVPR